MASDYKAIRLDNEKRYGTDIGRIGPMLLADRYDDRTHFIYELLQNAEDALWRRPDWKGSHSIHFSLAEHELRVSHFGKPFDEADVRGICGIAESTKGLTAIGRFGIGFKSVYAFTDRPEVHSGSENFAIEKFVWPVTAPRVSRDPEETIIAIPLKGNSDTDREEITAGLQRLGARTLLFLHEIEEIEWEVDGGPSGLYLRQAEDKGDGVRRIVIIGQETGKQDTEETWLTAAKPVATAEGIEVGHVEIAFLVEKDEPPGQEKISPISRSPLVVFFPTVLETHLGFLIQGPYRTTPSRDNVPRNDRWNRHCVQVTADLLVNTLRWLRDHALLDTGTLRCLPLESEKFDDSSMFAPLFDLTKQALTSESLLPRHDGGHLPAKAALLSRTQELRELFTTHQLAGLYSQKKEPAWLSGEITQDRTPELRRYLIQELKITEITPELIIPRLGKDFLEAQPDTRITRLYEFLNGQPALRKRLDVIPLIRLNDGKHVPAYADGQLQAFLPGAVATGSPTVRATVCETESAREFLLSLGLTEPDPVDEVIRNVLPKYRQDEVDVSDSDYATDIGCILKAFNTDSKAQRDKLVSALRETSFVMAVDAGDNSKWVSKPGDVYLATERLKNLFQAVPDVFLVDDDYSCLRGESVRELLEACGATRWLLPVPATDTLPWQKKSEIRCKAGLERASWERPSTDETLRGIDDILNLLSKLNPEGQRNKAALLWEALADVEARRSTGVFSGEYTWGYSHETKTATFDAAFVRTLNERAWVPDSNGDLQRPEMVLFDTLCWKPNPFLESKIRFKPPILIQLAKEAGIEPGVLDLLKRLGLTSEMDLRARLGVTIESLAGNGEPKATVDNAIKKLLGDTPDPTPPVPDPAGPEPAPPAGGNGRIGRGGGASSGGGHMEGKGVRGDGEGGDRAKGSRQGGGERTPGSDGGRPFISYVAVHPDDEGLDPDGLDHEARLALESKAIEFILLREPAWQRTPTNNPGYDLVEAGGDATPARWCEVKAMTGSLRDRPVGLSRTQLDCARDHGEAYWLYVVERAGEMDARIVRIQDPAGKARTFTFDRGWLDIADVDAEQENRED
jgi:hypothetical protein